MTDRLDPTTSGTNLAKLFCAAQELPEKERQALVTRVSQEDSALGDRLRELLAADEDQTAPRLAALWNWLDQQHVIIGEEVGDYRVVELLSHGGMAAVYLAEHRGQAGHRVALKVLHPHLICDGEHAHCLLEEARTVQRIAHPSVVDIIECGHLPSGQAYLVMPYLDGESLARRIRDWGRLPVARAVSITVQLLDILVAVHERGVVHRDLKPENIMLMAAREPRRERVMLLDFGIALHIPSDTAGAPTQTHTMRSVPPLQPHSRLFTCAHSRPLGTPLYMAPEQFLCPRSVDRRADLYSLGCILYAMICGRPPFTGSMAEIRYGHLQTPPSMPSTWGATVDPRLESLMDSLLAKDPGTRPQSAGDVLEHLARIDLSIPCDHGDVEGSGTIRSISSDRQTSALSSDSGLP